MTACFFVVSLCTKYPPMQVCIAVQSVFAGAVFDRPRIYQRSPLQRHNKYNANFNIRDGVIVCTLGSPFGGAVTTGD